VDKSFFPSLNKVNCLSLSTLQGALENLNYRLNLYKYRNSIEHTTITLVARRRKSDFKMKIPACLLLAALLLFTAFVQDTEAALALYPPGRRELERKVCFAR